MADPSSKPKSSKKPSANNPDQEVVERGRTSFAAALDALRVLVKPTHTKNRIAGFEASALNILDYLDQFRTIPVLNYSPTTTPTDDRADTSSSPSNASVAPNSNSASLSTEAFLARVELTIARSVEQSLQKELAKSPRALSAVTNSVSYAAAVGSPKPVEREVVLSLTGVAEAPEAVKAGNARAIKDFVSQAFSSVPELATVQIHGVRLLANRKVALQVETKEQAELVRRHELKWLQKLPQGTELSRRSVSIVADGVPTSFDPSADFARDAFFSENRSLIASVSDVRSLRWIHGSRTPRQAKATSSLVITLFSEAAADELLYAGATFEGAVCPTRKYIPTPVQCFRCQKYGHISSACPTKSDPLTVRCARCAGNHKTADCGCPAHTKCSDLRSCTHLKPQCANCSGAHKSFSNDCPIKQQAQAAVQRRPELVGPYFSPTFNPHAKARSHHQI